ncbi:MAG TPA: hypothetical protein VF989_02690 [Polyangiaceae bacterium]
MTYTRPTTNPPNRHSSRRERAGRVARPPWLRGLSRAGVLVSIAFNAGCAGASAREAEWPPRAKEWYDRASASFRTGDIDDAEYAASRALALAKGRPEVRVLAGRVALSRLEFDRVIELLEGIESADAWALKGRAHWYAGRLQRCADELEQLLADPEVRDPWAVDVARLARQGTGRRPFSMSGGLLAVAEMPRNPASALLVPLELNGEPALGLIATGTAEAVVDAGSTGEPSWVSLRFGERVEVRDVPALAKDLSGISRQLNAPVKILIGVNLLRHLRPTVDFAGGQFVVRTFEPPPPPQATTLHLNYIRGGGMLMRGAFGAEENAPAASLLVDTSMSFPLALDDAGWRKAGIDPTKLDSVPNVAKLRQGILPLLRLGAFELPSVPGVLGAPIDEIERGLDVEVDGLVGSGLLAAFRVTLVDGGRTLWLEDVPPPLPEAASEPDFSLQPPAGVDDSSEEGSASDAAPAAAPAKPNVAPAKPAPAKPSNGPAQPGARP